MLLGVGVVQIITRDGFDLDRHALSQLSLGPWGFVQIANFLVTGALVIAAARGLRGVPGAVWGPRLLAGFGAGMLVAAGVATVPGLGSFGLRALVVSTVQLAALALLCAKALRAPAPSH
ncbi:hypothetical protein GCM10010435_29460 [Winogradskya consettensis]|uniref:Uncharacterized protein n=1 Tax=Winogradskya consettensis TaxID=113560 RepID=A0A919VLN1_9ACTN|nr:DUF998 domain-containing protein [Actinoplanes consettensis]GIM70779.1 hypothetical protein Aco04nite_22040 [Actinoplanes consettensis]